MTWLGLTVSLSLVFFYFANCFTQLKIVVIPQVCSLVPSLTYWSLWRVASPDVQPLLTYCLPLEPSSSLLTLLPLFGALFPYSYCSTLTYYFHLAYCSSFWSLTLLWRMAPILKVASREDPEENDTVAYINWQLSEQR